MVFAFKVSRKANNWTKGGKNPTHKQRKKKRKRVVFGVNSCCCRLHRQILQWIGREYYSTYLPDSWKLLWGRMKKHESSPPKSGETVLHHISGKILGSGTKTWSTSRAPGDILPWATAQQRQQNINCHGRWRCKLLCERSNGEWEEGTTQGAGPTGMRLQFVPAKVDSHWWSFHGQHFSRTSPTQARC